MTYEGYTPIVLVGQGGNALYPFPCSVTIQQRTDAPAEDGAAPTRYYAVVCGGEVIMAKYSELVPAKLEVNRLREEWNKTDSMRPFTFEFAKDVK